MNSPTPAPASAATPSRSASALTALVVDDSSLCREMVCLALRGDGFTITSAADGRAGLSQLQKATPSVVVLDNEMPVMDGIDFLKTIRADPRWKNLPVVMLTTTVSREVIVEAIRLGISGYLLKDKFSTPEMLQRVRLALTRGQALKSTAAPPAPAKPPAPPRMSAPNLVSRDATIAAITDIASAKTLPGVLKHIADLAASGKGTVAELSVLARQDPVLTARVVQMGVSLTSLTGKTRVSNIDDAVRLIGVKDICEMASKMTAISEFPPDRADGIELLRCWQHANIVAAVMGRIVPKSDSLSAGIPHAIGICHDLCEMLLRQKFPSQFSAARDYSQQAHVPVNEILADVFGISYGELVQLLMEKLDLPTMILEPIKHYTPYAGSALDAYQRVLPRSLAIADFLAHGMLLGNSSEDLISPILQSDCNNLLIPHSALKLDELRADALAKTLAMAGLAPDPQCAVGKSLIESRPSKVLYLRSHVWAQLDPIAAALANLASIEIRGHLTRPQELDAFDGIVITSAAADDPQIDEAIQIRNASARQVHILNLVPPSDHVSEERPGVTDLTYPFPIRQLARFIATLNVQPTPAAAAAAAA